MFIVFNHALFLTDEQYAQEIAKRKQFIAASHEEAIGCPACFVPDVPKAPVKEVAEKR
jgi:hypothetical protein